jgi:hypothetical protein
MPDPLKLVAEASQQHQRWEATWLRAMKAARAQGYTLQQIADAAGLHNRQRAHQLTKEK